jgi:AbrB family looped-hinge helix DNA binding protein
MDNRLLINMQATVRMTRNGQVSIPIEIRETLDLKTGDLIVIDVLGTAKSIAKMPEH